MTFDSRELARRLDSETTLWTRLDPARRAEAVEAVAQGRWPLGGDGEVPEVFADGEDLAEGGVETALREDFQPVLDRCGLRLDVETVADPQATDEVGPYAIRINGREVWIWREFDLGESWWLATVRPLAVVNALLAEAGVTERIHVYMAGGNDGSAYLVDPRVAELMTESGLFAAQDVPALPEAELAAEGQPLSA